MANPKRPRPATAARRSSGIRSSVMISFSRGSTLVRRKSRVVARISAKSSSLTSGPAARSGFGSLMGATVPLSVVSDGPLIVQSDKTLLLEVDHPRAADCRRAIAPFAELERAPEHVHTYRLTPLGLWNARAAGHDAEQVVDVLLEYSRYPVPHALLVDVAETMARYGRLQLVKHAELGLVLHALDVPVLEEVLRSKKVLPLVGTRHDRVTVAVHPSERGHL